MNIKKVSVILGVLLMCLGGLNFLVSLRTSSIRYNHPQAVIKLNEITIQADIVDTEVTREQGLSGKEGLATSTGLFFVFDSENYWGIWMKDMKFSIDVLWFDKNGVIVGLEEDMKPESYPKVFIPSKQALYVLEIPVGTIKKSEIKMGDQAKIGFKMP